MNAIAGEGFEDLPILAELRGQLTSHYQAADRNPHRARVVRARRWRPLALVAVLVLGGTTGALAATGAATSLLNSSSPKEVTLDPSTGAVISVSPLSWAAYRALEASMGERPNTSQPSP
jgi:hypothetical protein